MKKNIVRIVLIATGYFLGHASVSRAALDGDLNTFFDSLGYSTRGAEAYQAQAAGYYDSGHWAQKFDTSDLQIMHIDLPSFQSGCGGIDLFKGGFSMINSQDLVEFFKATLNNAVGYSFTLAMESATPEIANVMKYLKDMADKVNQTNFNSCEMAEGLVGSLWSRVHSADRHVCAAVNNKGGDKDYAAARQACGAGGQLGATLRDLSADSGYRNLALYKANVAWQAAQHSKLLRENTELAELAMSLVGTIIFNADGKDAYGILMPLAGIDDVASALLYGGNLRIYACGGDVQCMNPDPNGTISVDARHAFAVKIKGYLEDLKASIIDGSDPKPEVKGLLQATSLPVLAMLKGQLKIGKNSAAITNGYADIIASDILFQYLQRILKALQAGSSALLLPAEVMEKFKVNLDNSLAILHERQSNAYNQLMLKTQMVTQAQTAEQALEDEITRRMKNNLVEKQF